MKNFQSGNRGDRARTRESTWDTGIMNPGVHVIGLRKPDTNPGVHVESKAPGLRPGVHLETKFNARKSVKPRQRGL
jgi:hypothetical protein